MLKNKVNLQILALALGLFVTFSQSAFKPATQTKVQLKQYQYDNNTSAGIDDPGNWTDVTGITPDVCTDGTALPCIIELDLDQTDLATFLDNHPSASSINSSPARRERKASL